MAPMPDAIGDRASAFSALFTAAREVLAAGSFSLRLLRMRRISHGAAPARAGGFPGMGTGRRPAAAPIAPRASGRRHYAGAMRWAIGAHFASGQAAWRFRRKARCATSAISRRRAGGLRRIYTSHFNHQLKRP